MIFSRLNAFGEVVGKPTDRPTSAIGQNNSQQVGLLFGHNGSGKVYSYLSKNKRVGDIVTPKVTHPKSGKEYKTLGRIVSTRNSTGGPAQDTAARLSSQGIMMKTLGPTDQTSLPGYQAKKAKDPNFTTARWTSESKQNYNDTVMKRLNTTDGNGDSV